VAIISILASIAIPAYNGYVETSKRSDAQASLMALAIAQEKYRAQCPSYAQNFGSAIDCDTSTLNFSSSSDGGYYTLVIVAGSVSAAGFTAQADPTFAQTSCDAADFQITEDGPDLGSDAKKACWGR